MLHIYNSLSRQKEVFKPIESGKVRMYVCGMTVYDYCHLGHARVLVVFDVVYRYLMAKGYDVTYVRNITDIDDKIINRAHERGQDIWTLTEHFIQEMHKDAELLSVLPPTVEPRATQNLEEIISMISTLVDKGFAYRVPSGDVYYSVSEFAQYGQLSGKRLEDLRAGERVEIGEEKQDPLDFALWKAAKPGEPSWESPWGRGRPGWHIECSAMSTKFLGNHFDIHGGGQDLQFPHHENEIAQSEACFGETFVNYWIHNGFVRVNEEKMSKSLGNFFTVQEVLNLYRPEEIRYFILSSHYRSPLNYGDEQLDGARQALTRLYTALRGLPVLEPPGTGEYRSRFEAAMDDDFNTAEALAVLFDLARDVNRAREENVQKAVSLGAVLKQLGSVLGLLQDDPEAYLQGAATVVRPQDSTMRMTSSAPSVETIEQRISERNAARKAKNWSEADRIRDELKADGVILEDGPEGTTWRRG